MQNLHRIYLTPQAGADVEKIAEYYNDLDPEQREAFLYDFYSCLGLLDDFPKLFQEEYRHVRGALLSAFPYKVLYSLYKEKVIVFSIFHTSQKPKK